MNFLFQTRQVLVSGILSKREIQRGCPSHGTISHPRRTEEQLLLWCGLRQRRHGQWRWSMVIIKSHYCGWSRIFVRAIVSCCNVTWCPVMHRTWLIAGCKVESVDQRETQSSILTSTLRSMVQAIMRFSKEMAIWQFYDFMMFFTFRASVLILILIDRARRIEISNLRGVDDV